MLICFSVQYFPHVTWSQEANEVYRGIIFLVVNSGLSPSLSELVTERRIHIVDSSFRICFGNFTFERSCNIVELDYYLSGNIHGISIIVCLYVHVYFTKNVQCIQGIFSEVCGMRLIMVLSNLRHALRLSA